MKKIFIVIIVLLVAGAGIWYIVSRNISPGSQPTTSEDNKNNMQQSVELREIASGFTSPIAFVPPHDATGRMFLVDQTGIIKIVDNQGNALPENFLDIREKIVQLSPSYDERGLLGLAFHPDFRNNGRFFLYYSAPLKQDAPRGWNCTNTVSEFRVSADNPNIADKASERIVLQMDHPQANHNAGHIAFGPDGYLYIPTGDGGGANDTGLGHSPQGNGQDTNTLLGKILRIDIDNGNPYSVPPGNPFVDKDGLDEIFAYGFRNPYRISFDSGGSNDLFVADVGQDLWEEIDIVTVGGNYGWNIKEGKHCFDPQNPARSPQSCPPTGAQDQPLVDPIIEYPHTGEISGRAIIGGHIYRGQSIPELNGNYVFADWSKSMSTPDGSIFIAYKENDSWAMRELKIGSRQNNRLGLFIRAVSQDDNNELYLLTTEIAGPSGNTGKIFKILPATGK